METITEEKNNTKHSYMVHFRGRIPMVMYENSKNNDSDSEYLVRELTEASSNIEDRINRWVSESLPCKSRVVTNIRFHEGSIEWEGVLHVLTWTSAVGGTIGLVDYLQKITMFAINNTIRSYLPPKLRRESIDTAVMVEDQTPHVEDNNLKLLAKELIAQSNQPPLVQNNPSTLTSAQASQEVSRVYKVLIATTFFNTALVGALVLLLIVFLVTGRL